MRKTRDVAERFWEKVDRGEPDACWLWTAGKHAFGYGAFQYNGVVLAHRFAWTLTHGPIANGLFVCHTCDVPACCNPNHLFLGTSRDNVRDMMAKGRSDWTRGPRGVDHGGAKLTPDAVRAIRALVASGLTERDAGARFGITQSTAHSIVSREIWRHVA